jgi:crossover junction endodeoxyribonuclease RusA
VTEPLTFDLGFPDDRITPRNPLSLTFVVYGEPIPQGSTKAFVVGGRARITNDNPRTRPWRALVNDAAHQAVGEDPPLAGPISVTLRFTLPRPKSRPARDRWPDRRPDLDKLVRAALDAFTGCVFHDDAQVVTITTTKMYVGNPNALREPGLVVDITPVLA